MIPAFWIGSFPVKGLIDLKSLKAHVPLQDGALPETVDFLTTYRGFAIFSLVKQRLFAASAVVCATPIYHQRYRIGKKLYGHR